MILILYIVIGALIGILLNYLADVLPVEHKFSLPVCKHCGEKYSIMNYLFSFHCPNCQSKPGMRYWLVLILSVLFSVLLAFFPLQPFTYWASLPLLIFLGLIVIIDVEHRAVLFETDFVGIALGLTYGWILHGIWSTLLGGLLGAAIMLGMYYLGILFNRIVAKIRYQEVDEVALGLGDVFVSGYLGLICGIQHVPALIILAVLLAGVFAIIYLIVKAIAKKYSPFSAIAYAPFLIAALLILFYLPS
ncbi:MAG: prepilin peptidase [Anaerolineaceae bacterium]|nr:prepilin peptidase [Anaerolineaceae bacterium]